MIEKKMTFGEKSCGVSFNPDNNPHVDDIKKSFAAIVDNLDFLRGTTDNAEIKRMISVAITEAQTAQMWAVKAVTWKY
jgi:hypothetical protein